MSSCCRCREIACSLRYLVQIREIFTFKLIELRQLSLAQYLTSQVRLRNEIDLLHLSHKQDMAGKHFGHVISSLTIL